MAAWFFVLIIAILLFGLYWLFLSPYSQIFGHFPYKMTTNEKVIALTFDDGPNEPYTSQILDYLKSTNAKATFFIVGKNAINNQAVLKRMVKEGHSVGVHSMNHKFTTYLTHPRYKNEVAESIQIITHITGNKPGLFRPPWLWRHPLLLGQLKKANLIPVSGVFSSNIEVFKPSADYIARKAIKKANPGSIIIFHDGYNSKVANRQKSVDAVKIFVNYLQKKGYKFIALDQKLFKTNN